MFFFYTYKFYFFSLLNFQFLLRAKFRTVGPREVDFDNAADFIQNTIKLRHNCSYLLIALTKKLDFSKFQDTIDLNI